MRADQPPVLDFPWGFWFLYHTFYSLLIEINCCEYLNTLSGTSASKKKTELVVVNPTKKYFITIA
jgi:hypothetical protein